MANLEFYCCDCELLFESEPDGTGYEQALCPKCPQICMTSEFEGKATKKDESKIRYVVVAEFVDEESAEWMIEVFERAEIPIQVNLPDVTEGDFFTGGSDSVQVLVPASMAEQARMAVQAFDEEE
ncbi:MAG: hypothetical protein AAGA30_06130 [Planctomycetota bacterium]